MNSATRIDHLVNIADNRYFVLGAYFFAFFPWAVMNNIDFISEKWRTVRRTRNLAYIHLLSSVVPVIYVAAYGEAQRRVDDSKEYGAALAALGFNLMHLMRTIMGMVQLDAFVEWCKHGVECMCALRGGRKEDYSPESDYVNDIVKVNNSVVDNELGGTDVTVAVSWKKIWNGLKRWELRPSAWLVTNQVKLCTVRWSGALLCSMGRDLSVPYTGKELLDLFFSLDLYDLRRALQAVRWNIGLESCKSELISIRGLVRQLSEVCLSGKLSTAYETEIPKYFFQSTFNSYSFEFDCLTSSYPSSNDDFRKDNRENIAVQLVDSVVLAKHYGVERLMNIRRYYDHYRLPTYLMRRNAFKLLLKQLKLHSTEYSRILEMLSHETRIPIFPYRMQMVALWDDATNWRVLQASAHQDIINSLNIGWSRRTRIPFFQLNPHPKSIFDYCAEFANVSAKEYRCRPCSLGVVLETVRTFLAEWLADGARKPDWEPSIATERFDFVLTENLPDGCYDYEDTLIWACQNALEKDVARTLTTHDNLPSNHTLVMLFLLGFPVTRVENVDDVEADAQKTQDEGQEPSTSLPSMDSSIDVSVRARRVYTVLAPQDISVTIRHDLETDRISLTLKNNSVGARFAWQDWVDAAMGYLKGFEESAGLELKYERTILRADLRESIVELCPFRSGYDDSVKKTGTAKIWMGWPPFDVHICKFEVDQLLAACDIDLSNISTLNDRKTTISEVPRAEELIEAILLATTNET